jgi:hypothetical protein
MTEMSQATRREFLELTIAALGPLLLGQGCSESSGDVTRVVKQPADLELPPTVIPLPEILEAYFQGASGKYVRAIGSAYLNPERVTESERARSDALAETAHAVSDADSLEVALARLDARIVRDFESGDVESLVGLQLARTELHLCALSAITHVEPQP